MSPTLYSPLSFPHQTSSCFLHPFTPYIIDPLSYEAMAHLYYSSQTFLFFFCYPKLVLFQPFSSAPPLNNLKLSNDHMGTLKRMCPNHAQSQSEVHEPFSFDPFEKN